MQVRPCLRPESAGWVVTEGNVWHRLTALGRTSRANHLEPVQMDASRYAFRTAFNRVREALQDASRMSASAAGKTETVKRVTGNAGGLLRRSREPVAWLPRGARGGDGESPRATRRRSWVNASGGNGIRRTRSPPIPSSGKARSVRPEQAGSENRSLRYCPLQPASRACGPAETQERR